MAEHLQVDITSLAGWEVGKRLPRDNKRLKLARTLGVELEVLFFDGDDRHTPPVSAALVDTIDHLPDLLVELLARTKSRLNALRLAAPYTTAAYIQREFRQQVAARIADGTLEVQRVEIFYDLKRLKETLSNIFRYDGLAYRVKSYCAGVGDIAPAIGGYFFDDKEFLLGGYWTGIPPDGRPSLRLSGAPFRTFFKDYWEEIWRRGDWINMRGAHDLSAVREIAFKLGLAPGQWHTFVTEARTLEIGDDAPPLV